MDMSSYSWGTPCYVAKVQRTSTKTLCCRKFFVRAGTDPDHFLVQFTIKKNVFGEHPLAYVDSAQKYQYTFMRRRAKISKRSYSQLHLFMEQLSIERWIRVAPSAPSTEILFESRAKAVPIWGCTWAWQCEWLLYTHIMLMKYWQRYLWDACYSPVSLLSATINPYQLLLDQ